MALKELGAILWSLAGAEKPQLGEKPGVRSPEPKIWELKVASLIENTNFIDYICVARLQCSTYGVIGSMILSFCIYIVIGRNIKI